MALQQVSPKQLATMLAAFIPARMPLLITGMPGIGKSDIVAQAAKAAGFKLLISHPAVADPTDFKGLPWPDKSGVFANFIPFGDFHTALTATEPLVWFFDDLGQAPPSVQSAAMQLFLARRVNGHVLPDCVTFVGATNRRIDRAGVAGLLEPVKSRFDSIVELVPTLNDWKDWAFDNGIPATLIAFLSFRSELLAKFEPSADLTNSPLPRTHYHVARIEALGLPHNIEAAAFAGAVGEAAAVEYIGFRKLAASITSIEAILLNPDTVDIPTAPDQLYATVIGLAARATAKNFARIAVYANRLVKGKSFKDGNGRGEFAVLMIRDIMRRDPKLAYTDTFIKLNSGELGKLITGSN